jgi:hypothetical protein
LRAVVILRRFFDKRKGNKVGIALASGHRSIQNSTRVRTHACLPTAQISIPPHKKGRVPGDRCDRGNTAPKAGDCTARSGKIGGVTSANSGCAHGGTSLQARSHLAINWQRGPLNARFTSIDRRFPTPQPTTRHLFWPKQRTKAASVLPIWLRNSDFPAVNGDRGAGGSASRTRRKASIQTPLGIFCLMDPAPCSAPSKKERSRRKRRRPTPTSAPVVSTVP